MPVKHVYDVFLLSKKKSFMIWGIVSSSHVGMAKSNPELFRQAMNVSGSTADMSLMIGDWNFLSAKTCLIMDDNQLRGK